MTGLQSELHFGFRVIYRSDKQNGLQIDLQSSLGCKPQQLITLQFTGLQSVNQSVNHNL